MNIIDTANLIVQAFNDNKRIFLIMDDKDSIDLIAPMSVVCKLMNDNDMHTAVVISRWEDIISLLQEDDLVIAISRGVDKRSTLLNSKNVYYVPIRLRYKKSFEVVPRMIMNLCGRWERLASG